MQGFFLNFLVLHSSILHKYPHRLWKYSSLTMHLCLQMANGALVGGGVGVEGWCEQGLRGWCCMRYIIWDEPSCAALFSPWVKQCQPSWLMCPPALTGVGAGWELRSMSRLTLITWSRWKRDTTAPTSLFRLCVAMAAQLLCCQKPCGVIMIMQGSNDGNYAPFFFSFFNN